MLNIDYNFYQENIKYTAGRAYISENNFAWIMSHFCLKNEVNEGALSTRKAIVSLSAVYEPMITYYKILDTEGTP